MQKVGVGYTWGIYYRQFHWQSGETLWTLMTSLWYPMAVFAALPLIWQVRCRFWHGRKCPRRCDPFAPMGPPAG